MSRRTQADMRGLVRACYARCVLADSRLGEGMAYYALFHDVVDDFIARRPPFREEHLSLARTAHRSGGLVLAGALAEPADGALIVFRGDSPEVANSFAERDPYVRNGLVKHWEVRPWTVVVGGEPTASTSAQGGC